MPPPDWQLPPGVSRGLWEYFHDPAIARNYDAQLADAPLFRHDIPFVQKHCPKPGRLLDLGCGTGRLAVAMAQAGHQVTAVDLSDEMLAIVRAKGPIECVKANLVELDALPDRTFDAAGCLFGTLGMIQGEEPRGRFLRHVARVLKPGGSFVLHVHNRWFHLTSHAGRRLLLKNAWDRLRGRRPLGDFPMPSHQGIAGFTMHLFTRSEVARVLNKAGFAIREVWPLGLGDDLKLPKSWLFPSIRSQGYLIAAESVA